MNFSSNVGLFSERASHLLYEEGTVMLIYDWLAFADAGSLGPGSRDAVGRVIPSGRPRLHSPSLPFNERSVECPWEMVLTAGAEGSRPVLAIALRLVPPLMPGFAEDRFDCASGMF